MRFSKFILVASTLALAACGNGAPSASDIEDAMENSNKQKIEQLRAQFGDGPQMEMAMEMVPSFSDVVVESCEQPDGVKGHVCKFTVTIESMGAKQENLPQTGTFVKTDGDWVMIGL